MKKNKTSLKKRIFALVGVAVTLFSVMVIGVSASDGSSAVETISTNRDYSLCDFVFTCSNNIDTFYQEVYTTTSNDVVRNFVGVDSAIIIEYAHEIVVVENGSSLAINAYVFNTSSETTISINNAGGFYVYRDSGFIITNGTYFAGDGSIENSYSLGFVYGDNQYGSISVTGNSVNVDTLFADVPQNIDFIYVDFLSISTRFYNFGEDFDFHYYVDITNGSIPNVPTEGIDIFGVFTKVSEWMVTAFGNVTPMFFVPETGLTFLGVLSCAGLAVVLCLLIIAIVTKFLGFGG